MKALPIAHIGILVADLPKSRTRWTTVMGLPFSPITRYRPQNWSDLGNPEPHLHDARLTFCLGDSPSIELLEFVGNGTHSPSKGEGGHHLSFPPLPDVAARRVELAELGIGVDGEIFHDGRWIFTFGDARPLNNVYTEWVEEHPDHPDVKDDLSPINRLPDGSKTLFDLDTVTALNGRRPDSGIVEIGIDVADLSTAVRSWEAATGYRFVSDTGEGLDTAVSHQTNVRLRLLPSTREGLSYAVIDVDDLDATRFRLDAAQVPFSKHTAERTEIRVGVDYVNKFSIRFRAAR